MRDGAVKMSRLALKLAKGESIGSPEEEGYLPRGIRRNYFASQTGASRAVTMLLKKLKGEPFITEYPMPVFDRVAPLPPVERLSEATLALITSGGIVPKGNPDRIESSSASRFGKYDISDLQQLTAETHETAHGGYDPTYANEDPHRVLPLDVVRDLEREGMIGKLYPYYYATVGNGTSVAHAKEFAQEIVKDLVRSRRPGRNHHIHLRVLHALRRNDGKGNRKSRNPGSAYLHHCSHLQDRGSKQDYTGHSHSPSAGRSWQIQGGGKAVAKRAGGKGPQCPGNKDRRTNGFLKGKP